MESWLTITTKLAMGGVRVTPELLRSGYDLLRTTQPFSRWKLPPGEEVRFRARAPAGHDGYYHVLGEQHCIDISPAVGSQLMPVLRVLAHEIVHLRIQLRWPREQGHGPRFRRLADQVCRHHGFDRANF